MEFLSIQNSYLIFSKILPRRLLGTYLWNELALTAKMTHLKGQTIPGVKRSEQVNAQFCRYSCAIVNGIFDDPKFDLIFANILPGLPLRLYLWSQLALKAKKAHCQGQTIPESAKPTNLPIFECYSPSIFW
ncbi:hypothetical protein H5410_064082 [Solanum commersonii]|uniref:Uncharacterized protein n=1 Tax=Solanum commersonii TaxID=4109 RepID=A0A9J5W0N7_SOLCO|nr:hypothetical protein H5410_064082 [Solanum commersonii]